MLIQKYTGLMYPEGCKPKLDNFAILVWKMNLVKNKEFVGQLGENQPIFL